ncbi:MAG: alpha-D-glucose phosphate-specific phosphoglucomutase [Phycisphaeraceae bacterium]|nr:alpha-D-glucose phosphate-specific phosphoglucomutase [Phycisphaeraceae bacterium]
MTHDPSLAPAGQPGGLATSQDLVDLDALLAAYHDRRPDPSIAAQQVAFGTSGHRGSALDTTFNDDHIAAITQAIVEFRSDQGIDGPVLLGKDTHALSGPAERTAVEVLSANGVAVRIQGGDGITATPIISRAILAWNQSKTTDDSGRADGIIITPSHNPPRDGGFKYNPPDGGPAGGDITGRVERRANEILAGGLDAVRRTSSGDRPLTTLDHVEAVDFIRPYVEALAEVIDLEPIRDAGLRLATHPLGGASFPVWPVLAEVHGIDVTIVDDTIDPRFAFMTLDKDGLIRMDCSSPQAMAPLVARMSGGEYDLAFGNDPDSDRHGIVCRSSGLMNPNRFLAVAIRHLLATRTDWKPSSRIGKTLVSSVLIDRVVADAGRTLCEVPVGFKWFAPGLFDGSIAFGGEESAGASFLTRDGRPWTTDSAGIVMDLLAAEILATTGRDPGEHEAEIVARFGDSTYRRISAPADAATRSALKALDASAVTATELAGDAITATLTRAPGNDAAVGGLKVTTEHGWFAARPSGTEPISKIYAESLKGPEHVERILDEAQSIVAAAT